MTAALNLTGTRFGMLIALRRGESGSHGKARWLCRCDCGREELIRAGDLRSGQSRSCGCMVAKRTSERRRTHGQSCGSVEYTSWTKLRTRCNNPNDKRYARYGGRGIKVCERWNSFENFLADMGPRPPDKSSIDRINNDGNYEPGNCRWATDAEQRANKTTTKKKPGLPEQNIREIDLQSIRFDHKRDLAKHGEPV